MVLMNQKLIVRDSSQKDVIRDAAAVWQWRIGFMIDTADLIGELTGALAEMGARWEFQVSASAPPYEIAAMVERQRPDVIFVELSAVSGPPQEWISILRSGSD